MANIPLINYYARLLHKGYITRDDIPDEHKTMVDEALERLFPEDKKEDAGVV